MSFSCTIYLNHVVMAWFPSLETGIKNLNNSQNYQWSAGNDLTVALRGTTRGLWFQSQAARAINHHDATLFTSQTEA